MAQIQKGTTYSTGNATVTIDNLNAHVDSASLLPGAISDQNALAGNAAPSTDQVLILASGQLKKATVVQALGGVIPSELLNSNNNLSDLADIPTAKANLSLNLVENKSSATIRSEITSGNVTTALGYTPPTPSELTTQINTRIATSQLAALNGVATLGGDGKLTSNQVAALNSTAQLAVLGTQALAAIGAQPLLTLPLAVAQGGTGQTASTGSGAVVLANSPTLVTPALGTPSSGNLANCTGLPVGGITGVSGVTGTGNLVLSNSPTLTTPVLGTPASGNLSNCAGLPVSGISGVLPVLQGGTGVTTSFGSGSIILAKSSPAPTIGQIPAWNSSLSQFEFKNQINYLSSVSLTNQTFVDFQIPVLQALGGVKKITILFDQVVQSDMYILVQVGVLSPEQTGYSGSCSWVGTSSAQTALSGSFKNTSGLLLYSPSLGATTIKTGVVRIFPVNNSSNSQIISGSLSSIAAGSGTYGSVAINSTCSIQLGFIQVVRITTVGQTTQFTSGNLNCTWE